MTDTKYKNTRRILRVLEFGAALLGSLTIFVGIYHINVGATEMLIREDVPALVACLAVMAATRVGAAILDTADTNREILAHLKNGQGASHTV